MCSKVSERHTKLGRSPSGVRALQADRSGANAEADQVSRSMLHVVFTLNTLVWAAGLTSSAGAEPLDLLKVNVTARCGPSGLT